MGQSESSSQANQSTRTDNIDKRIVNESGIVATEGANITANVQRVDADIVKSALATVQAADATAGDGYNKLLGLTEKILSGASQSIEKSQYMVLSTMATVNNDSKGQMDQKTIMIIGVAAMGMLAATKMKRAA